MIPKMRSTNDAVEYGRQIRGNVSLINALWTRRERLQERSKKLYAQVATGKNDNRGCKLGFLTQLYREAAQMAEGTLKTFGHEGTK
ncbi:MAG: hypothetical protein A2293_07995 [Elusimicrobia bacterium RIFOXYB2_FULL_49_7]|nr:MAG: hypothetical protein A2293_07995 [Elusimicrobia bacterium RIFOXYB2_FULL_49_7]